MDMYTSIRVSAAHAIRAGAALAILSMPPIPAGADEAGRRAFSRTVAEPPERMTEPRHNLARISVPTLVLWAERDRLFGKRIARRLCQDLPRASMIVVPDCGHFLQEEQPKLITKHLRSFLDQEAVLAPEAAEEVA